MDVLEVPGKKKEVLRYEISESNGTHWVLGFIDHRCVWNTLFIDASFADDVIEAVYSDALMLEIPTRLRDVGGHTLYPSTWRGVVIEPPYTEGTTTAWVHGHVEAYQWWNLGPEVHNARQLGL